MSSRERIGRVAMSRIALVAPRETMRAVLSEVADAGTVDLDPVPDAAATGAGEANDELDHYSGGALAHGRVSALLGWTPAAALPELRARVEPLGGVAVDLPAPLGVEPPTLLAPRSRVAPFRLLIDTYGTVRYADVDPTPFAAFAFAVMFGMMFGDAGRGLLLIGLGLWARTGRGLIGRMRPGWALAVAAGVSATLFGVAYGEFFGPTHVLPAVWLRPLDEPVRLLVAGLAVGAALLAVSYVIGSVNRWREGGMRVAVYEPSGLAGLCSYAGLGLLVIGLYEGVEAITVAGGVLVGVGVVLVFVGRYTAAGGHGAGAAQATVESVDGVVRMGSNVVSFARLAAFGLTAAAIGAVVWDGTTALWGPGGAALAAIALFVVGNLAAFALEALVVGVQALRLEYYELFSRIFGEQGRPFHAWYIPRAAAIETEEDSCISG
ncbi:MAG TPA: V-type ATPase 116kDa subunit family protein [Acidimicrobiia bacterium]|nr:V-type ATPase 116kDa subunit family protein [Acidimicrobiia bacterium]